jgi:hypothetical protein
MAGLGEWEKAIRDHPDRLGNAPYRALVCLALRLDWVTGTGFASVPQIAADARCGTATVRRAITWARDRGLLDRLQRGGRHGISVSASEYLTLVPSQQITRDPLGTVPKGSNRAPKRSNRAPKRSKRAPKRSSGDHPSKSTTSKSTTSNAVAVATAGPTAQTIIAEFVDWDRDNGGTIASRTTGHLSRLVAEALRDGFGEGAVKRGLAEWRSKGLHPSSLPSCIDAAARPLSRRRLGKAGGIDWDAALARAEALDAAEARGEAPWTGPA